MVQGKCLSKFIDIFVIMRSIDFAREMSANGRNCFTIGEAYEHFKGQPRSYLSQKLTGMVNTGMLARVSRGVYCIVPVHKDPEKYVPDWTRVASCLMQGRESYLGYHSALELYGLAKEETNVKYIVTPPKPRFNTVRYKGTEFRNVNISRSNFFGTEEREPGLWISNLEKTIVDICARPQYCGGIIELARAVLMTAEHVDMDKLFFYFSVNGIQAAWKRYLYLTDLLDRDWTGEHERLLEELGPGYSVLDPLAEKKGERNTRFRIILNMDTDMIKKEVEKF